MKIKTFILTFLLMMMSSPIIFGQSRANGDIYVSTYGGLKSEIDGAASEAQSIAGLIADIQAGIELSDDQKELLSELGLQPDDDDLLSTLNKCLPVTKSIALRLNSVRVPEPLKIAKNVEITLDLNQLYLEADGNGNVFQVEAGGKLSLRDEAGAGSDYPAVLRSAGIAITNKGGLTVDNVIIEGAGSSVINNWTGATATIEAGSQIIGTKAVFANRGTLDINGVDGKRVVLRSEDRSFNLYANSTLDMEYTDIHAEYYTLIKTGVDTPAVEGEGGNVTINIADNVRFANTRIENVYYLSLEDALAAAENGETVTLMQVKDNTVTMRGEVINKSVKISTLNKKDNKTTVEVNWNDLRVGRTLEGSDENAKQKTATLEFVDANIVSLTKDKDSGAILNISGSKEDADNVGDGKVIINNSTVDIDYIVNRRELEINGKSTVTLYKGLAVGGRIAGESQYEEEQTATLSLKGESKLKLENSLLQETTNVNGAVAGNVGYEGKGEINIDGTSSLLVNVNGFTVSPKGTIIVNGGTFKVGDGSNNAPRLLNGGNVNILGKASLAIFAGQYGKNFGDNGFYNINGTETELNNVILKGSYARLNFNGKSEIKIIGSDFTSSKMTINEGATLELEGEVLGGGTITNNGTIYMLLKPVTTLKTGQEGLNINTVPGHKVVYNKDEGVYYVTKKEYAVQIVRGGELHKNYELFEEALAEVEDGDVINIYGTKTAQSGKTITRNFEQPIEFTIDATGDSNYRLGTIELTGDGVKVNVKGIYQNGEFKLTGEGSELNISGITHINTLSCANAVNVSNGSNLTVAHIRSNINVSGYVQISNTNGQNIATSNNITLTMSEGASLNNSVLENANVVLAGRNTIDNITIKEGTLTANGVGNEIKSKFEGIIDITVEKEAEVTTYAEMTNLASLTVDGTMYAKANVNVNPTEQTATTSINGVFEIAGEANAASIYRNIALNGTINVKDGAIFKQRIINYGFIFGDGAKIDVDNGSTFSGGKANVKEGSTVNLIFNGGASFASFDNNGTVNLEMNDNKQKFTTPEITGNLKATSEANYKVIYDEGEGGYIVVKLCDSVHDVVVNETREIGYQSLADALAEVGNGDVITIFGENMVAEEGISYNAPEAIEFTITATEEAKHSVKYLNIDGATVNFKNVRNTINALTVGTTDNTATTSEANITGIANITTISGYGKFNLVEANEGETATKFTTKNVSADVNASGKIAIVKTVNETSTGKFNMNNVKLDQNTNLWGANIDFVEGTNTVNDATFDGGKFNVNDGATVNATAANITSNTTVNGTLNITDANPTLSALTVNGTLKVSKSEENADNTYTFKVNSNYFYLNGTATFDGVNAETGKVIFGAENANLEVNGGANFVADNAGNNPSMEFNAAATVTVDGEESTLTINDKTIVNADNVVMNFNATVEATGNIEGTTPAINMNDKGAEFRTSQTSLTISTTVENSKVVYENGAYIVVPSIHEGFDAVAIDGDGYPTLKEALEVAAEMEETEITVELLRSYGKAIDMQGAVVGGKTITIVPEKVSERVIGNENPAITVDWYQGPLYVGRGDEEGDGTLIFEGVNLKSSEQDPQFTGNRHALNISGAKKDNDNVNDGSVIIKDSYMEVGYIVNRNSLEIINSNVVSMLGYSVGGRLKGESGHDKDITAETTLKNNSTLTMNKFIADGLGYQENDIDGKPYTYAKMSIDETSKFICKDNFEIGENAVLNINGGKFTVESDESDESDVVLTNNGIVNVYGAAKSTNIDKEGIGKFIMKDRHATLETNNDNLLISKKVEDSVDNYEVIFDTDKKMYRLVNEFVAKIDDVKYSTFAEALEEVKDGKIIELIWEEGDRPIEMAGALSGKNATVIGPVDAENKPVEIEITVDWSAGYLFIGRGAEKNNGDAILTFKDVKLKSLNDGLNADGNVYGIHVSGFQSVNNSANTTHTPKYDGHLEIFNSTIELSYLVNRHDVTVDGESALTLINETSMNLGGRPAKETNNNAPATAKFTIKGKSNLIAKNIYVGYEGIGVMDVEAGSSVEINEGAYELKIGAASGNYGVGEGKLLSSGNISGKIVKTDDGSIELKGGIYTQDVNDFCHVNYSAYPYVSGTWIVREDWGSQTIELNKGWSWISSYMKNFSGVDGFEMLTNSLGDLGVQIKNQTQYTTYVDKEWFGSLKETSYVDMYKVKTDGNVTLEFNGQYVDYDSNEAEIVLYPGWNYIGYPVSFPVKFTDALYNFTPTVGDVFKSHYGASVYEPATEIPELGVTAPEGWNGNLTELEPGQGYMYYNASKDVKSFKYSANANVPTRTTVTEINKHWNNTTSYPSNMTMVAMVSIDGEIVNDNYEVAAFANGELRGSARPVYIEAIDAYVLYLTIQGEDVEELTFKYYDVNYGTEYELDNRINYSNDAIVGSISEPYILTMNITDIEEVTLNDVNIYPNPTTTGVQVNLDATCEKVEIFNALGVKVAEYQNVDSIDAFETSGIYVIRLTNGGEIKHTRLVVR